MAAITWSPASTNVTVRRLNSGGSMTGSLFDATSENEAINRTFADDLLHSIDKGDACT